MSNQLFIRLSILTLKNLTPVIIFDFEDKEDYNVGEVRFLFMFDVLI